MGFCYKGYDVVIALNLAVAQYGVPERIRVDNSPEFISKEVDLYAYGHGVVLDFSRPGKPTDNAFIESFNSRFRATTGMASRPVKCNNSSDHFIHKDHFRLGQVT
ncbi:MAG: integrase core domain-containing protein [Desulfobaccales bacterium]